MANLGRTFTTQFRTLHFALGWFANYEPATKPESIGGQAVIEGVMMRSPRRLAVAVRAPDGNIVLDNREFVPYSRRHWILSLPILRGASSLIESLAIGLRALNFSIAVQETGPAQGNLSVTASETHAPQTEAPPTPSQSNSAHFGQPTTSKDKMLIAMSLGMSFLLAMAFFQFLPYFVSGHLIGGTQENSATPLLFNATAGAVRMSLLLVYLWGISRLPDVSRVFAYHGAEHKSIFTHENGQALTPAQAGKESRFHPRCGTSFILIVALTCVIFFSIFDALLLKMGFHYPNFAYRFLIHLPFIPFVAGLAFEILKLSARYQDSIFIKPLIFPGLWLQRITTREPDAAQLEVAIASIKASLA